MNEIKKIRKKIGLTQKEMYIKYGIPIRTLQNWEAGRNSPPEWAQKAFIRIVKEDFLKGE